MRSIRMSALAVLAACAAAFGCGGAEVAPSPAPVTGGSPPAATTYKSENRSLVSNAVTRTFVLARPDPMPSAALPLVLSLHGDGGNGAGMRGAMPLEASAAGGAVFVYPDAPGGTFEYYTYDGRTREAQFVRDVVTLLAAELGIDRARVFVTGMSGGATMANALGCHLGPAVLRGLGLHSGTLYPVNDANGQPDFTYTASGGVSCALPAAIFVWGKLDVVVEYQSGLDVRDNYRATQSCGQTTSAWMPSPCEVYSPCNRGVVWCPIDGMGHAIWSGAAGAIWAFFDGLR